MQNKKKELKKILKSKRIEKGLGKRLKLNKLIKKATNNLNKTRSAKYNLSINQIKEKSLENNCFTDIYDFHTLVRIKEHKGRTVRCMEKQGDQKKRKLREPLHIGEKVLVIAEYLKKKDVLGIFYKSLTENEPFFN